MFTALGFTIFLTGLPSRICGFALCVHSLSVAAFVEVIFRQPKRVAETITTPRFIIKLTGVRFVLERR
jgi:hypothetical protein